MWKKFTNLLFEDDEEELIEEEVVKPVAKEVKTEIKEEVKKDVDIFESAKDEKKSLGLKIDELQEKKEEKKESVVEQAVRTEAPVYKKPIPRVVPTSKPEVKNSYEFTPVISPIFGVSDKDVDAIIPTANKKKVENRSDTIISPMYGVNKDDKPSKMQTIENNTVASFEEVKEERDIKNLSIDDILKGTNTPVNDLDKTTVFTSHNMSLFDDDEE